MTPNDIEVLIHHHVSPNLHPRAHSPAVQMSIDMFVMDGILKEDGLGYRTTERGVVLMRMLCDTEYPQQAWVDNRKERVEA